MEGEKDEDEKDIKRSRFEIKEKCLSILPIIYHKK
jgi:hypothetical protein